MASLIELLLIATCVGLGAVGCSDDDARAPAGGSVGNTPPPAEGVPCGTPTTGCACTAEGTTASCTIKRAAGDYVSCSEGTLRCGKDLRWGPCEGAASSWEDAGR